MIAADNKQLLFWRLHIMALKLSNRVAKIGVAAIRAQRPRQGTAHAGSPVQNPS